MSIPWTKKYQPKKVAEVSHQSTQIERMQKAIENFKQQRKKGFFLHGPPGSGKTSAVYAIANDLQLEIVELNASDFRKKDNIQQVIGGAIQQQSLFSMGKIILLDEVEGISGQKDRGGIPTLAKLIEKSSFPIIVIGIDPYTKKSKPLRKKLELLAFEPIPYELVLKKLVHILEMEKVTYEEVAVKTIARRAGGDLRAAVNDLQSLASKGITKERVDHLSDRFYLEQMQNALLKIFKTSQPKVAVQAFNRVSEDLDKCLLWVDENVPREYTEAEDLAAAYHALSRADIYRGRIRRWMYWRLLVYVNAHLTIGVAVSKQEKNPKAVEYKETKRLLKLWMAKMKYGKRTAIAEKVAAVTHTSPRRVLQETLPYIKFMMQKNHDLAERFAEEFDLSEDEMVWMTS